LKQVLEPSARANIGNVNRWFTTLVNQKQFKAVLGEVHLCVKAGAAPVESKGSRGGDNKQKKEKPKKEQKKAEPKRAASPPPEEEVEEYADKPTKDPFEAYPKG